MSKKQIILNLFNSIEWHNHHDGNRTKTITDELFRDAGLYPYIENASQHCDVIYARKIIQGLGHKVLIGSAFHVWEGINA